MNTLDTLASLQDDVLTAGELAARAGIPDDEDFRRSITHNTQGDRPLARSKEKLLRADDPKVRYERVSRREKALAMLSPDIRDKTRQANQALYGDPLR